MNSGKLVRLVLLILVLALTSVGVVAQDNPNPATVTVAGTIQSVLGCPGDWQPECDVTFLTYDADDDIWRATFDLPPGDYEYKAALNGTWDLNYGLGAQANGSNIPLSLAEDTSVTFFFDAKTGWITDNVNSIIATVPGNYQSEIGCADTSAGLDGDWEPSCLRSWLQDADGDGIYTFRTPGLPAGNYEAKVAVNESWNENYGLDGAPGGANIPFTVPEDDTTVDFVWDSNTKVMTILIGGEAPVVLPGNIQQQAAHWVSESILLWDVARIPQAAFYLHYSMDGAIELTPTGVAGGDFIELTYDREGLTDAIVEQFPHLADFEPFRISDDDRARVPDLLKGQLAVSTVDNQGTTLAATGVQIQGVLDDLYTYEGDLGITLADGVPTLTVWAPTARAVRLHLFDDSATAEAEILDMTAIDGGAWTITGDESWLGQFYLYEVEVYVYSTNTVETNIVTDPYSLSLATNSTRSQIIDLNDPALFPDGWDDLAKPELVAPEDAVIYEMHVRDFSIFDQTVPEAYRGTFMAFTVMDSDGMTHLRTLAEAGLTHLHLLPAFDIATVNENVAERVEPDYAALEALPPDSPEQQAMVEATRNQDGFNWGYDPYHYTVPEGSYSTNPDGPQRILEFRSMVMALNQIGLRVVMDVVYNHTNSAGQGERSVLDRIVPGYYHRRDAGTGAIATSTCCPNTATEHHMMQRLMLDSLRVWSVDYKVDGYRFDLMGHHMLRDMVEVREMLDSLTLETDGVDGSAIYVYGEGWNFGEVADNARGVNATQGNIGGTGIGVFNDRLRDAVRGGNPFGGRTEQGFVSDLYFAPNGLTPGSEDEQLARLLLFADQIRVGMAGNLRDYSFVGASGEAVTGMDVPYSDQTLGTGYTLDPQENIIYVSKHDNETLWDIIQYKGLDLPVADLVRMHNLGINIVLLSQGVPFFHAGDDLLRSKSLDRNSYDSGDWFNRIDWTYQTNNWGVGLPSERDNGDRWEEMQPLLADESRRATPEDIQAARLNFLEFLQIRRSSPLFRLQTAEQITRALTFGNTGPDQIPGLIVMRLTDVDDLDENHDAIVVVVNASPEAVTYTEDDLAGQSFELHPVLVNSHDAVVQTSAFDSAAGRFTVPARTTAVFVLPQSGG
jgi:pullulanase-type alpha-1,6-glucosidase